MTRPLEVVMCVMPWELDAFERSVAALAEHADAMRLVLDATLCAADASDDASPARRFEAIGASLAGTAATRLAVDRDGRLAGCVDVRRAHLRRCAPDATVVWLDPDVVFSRHALPALAHAVAQIPEPLHVVTPRIPRMWDETWDVLVHPALRDRPLGDCWSFDAGRARDFDAGPVGLRRAPRFKFAGGWLTAFSGALLRLVDLPDRFRPYGREDTYLMRVCRGLERRGLPVAQYRLDGVLAAQDLAGAAAAPDAERREARKRADAVYNDRVMREEAPAAVERCARAWAAGAARDSQAARVAAIAPSSE
jgi:hypothetical protein